jgi:hypothetical protein
MSDNPLPLPESTDSTPVALTKESLIYLDRNPTVAKLLVCFIGLSIIIGALGLTILAFFHYLPK